MSGYVDFEKDTSQITGPGGMSISVSCTPYWEGMDGIALSVMTEYGEDLGQDLIKCPKITGDSKTDATAYFKVMQGVLTRVEKSLKKGDTPIKF
jgi:hypothetical protein